METNFFERIKGLQFQGNLNLTIGKATDGKFTVSVLLANPAADKAGTNIPPMILRGEANELDEGFFKAITTPVERTASLFVNMEAYEKSLTEAQQKSRMELDKKNKGKGKNKSEASQDENDDDDEQEKDGLFSNPQAEQQEKAEKKRRYEEAMSKISLLNKDCKYSEAISLLPQVEDYPEKESEITAKARELAKRRELFEALQQEL